jgi:hypothetical protein
MTVLAEILYLFAANRRIEGRTIGSALCPIVSTTRHEQVIVGHSPLLFSHISKQSTLT